jgi:hypothetical protein
MRQLARGECGISIPQLADPGQSRGFLVVASLNMTMHLPLARLALNPHIKDMDEPHTKFEPIQLKDDSGWYVRITLPHGVQNHISYFKTEAEARTWIGENSAKFATPLF